MSIVIIPWYLSCPSGFKELHEYSRAVGSSSAIIRFSLASYSAALLPETLCYIFRA